MDRNRMEEQGFAFISTLQMKIIINIIINNPSTCQRQYRIIFYSPMFLAHLDEHLSGQYDFSTDRPLYPDIRPG